MSKWLSFALGRRFSLSRRYGALARFMSLSSTVGIAVGVCALIVGLSAMNGFERELENRVLSLIPAAQLKNDTGLAHYEEDLKVLRQGRDILAAAPTVELGGVFSKDSSFAPAALFGIDPNEEREVVAFDRFMDVSADTLVKESEANPIILGAGLARRLNLKTGDEVDFITVNAQGGENLLQQPVSATFKVIGFVTTGGQIDSMLAFTSLENALETGGLSYPNVIHLKTLSMLNAGQQAYQAARGLADRGSLTSWMTTQGKLYNDIQMIRGVMYIAMILVMAVACFNIVANLIMSVSEKSREIAILLTMGAKRGLILKAFTCCGLLSGMRGTLYGLVFGCLISEGLTPFTVVLKEYSITLLNPDIYFVSFIPAELKLSDVVLVAACAIIMSLLASLYPALKASRIAPARELSM